MKKSVFRFCLLILFVPILPFALAVGMTLLEYLHDWYDAFKIGEYE